jgi:hypothetical protein
MPADLDKNGSEAVILFLRLMLSERRGASLRMTIENNSNIKNSLDAAPVKLSHVFNFIFDV